MQPTRVNENSLQAKVLDVAEIASICAPFRVPKGREEACMRLLRAAIPALPAHRVTEDMDGDTRRKSLNVGGAATASFFGRRRRHTPTCVRRVSRSI